MFLDESPQLSKSKQAVTPLDSNLSLTTIQENVTIIQDIQEINWSYLALCVIPLWIAIGNSLVLIAVIGNAHLRTSSNIIVASLAVTDMLVAVLVCPTVIYAMVSYALNFF